MGKALEIRFSGITNKSFRGPKSALQAARGSVYEWWWRYAQLSPVFWFARESGLDPVDREMARVFARIGRDDETEFGAWWLAGGYTAFAEPCLPKTVRLLSAAELHDRVESDDAVIVEVPLTIPRAQIDAEIRRLVGKLHPGRRLNPSLQSGAILRVQSTRSRVHALENQYWALLYRLMFPSITDAQIGDRLQFSPQKVIRDDASVNVGYRYYSKWDPKTGPHQHLMALTGRYLYKARFALGHLQRGVFPCYSAYDEGQPFGPEAHEEYKAATACSKGVDSPYRQWLRSRFLRSLKREVVDRNRLREALATEQSIVNRRFASFLSGKSDRLLT